MRRCRARASARLLHARQRRAARRGADGRRLGSRWRASANVQVRRGLASPRLLDRHVSRATCSAHGAAVRRDRSHAGPAWRVTSSHVSRACGARAPAHTGRACAPGWGGRGRRRAATRRIARSASMRARRARPPKSSARAALPDAPADGRCAPPASLGAAEAGGQDGCTRRAVPHVAGGRWRRAPPTARAAERRRPCLPLLQRLHGGGVRDQGGRGGLCAPRTAVPRRELRRLRRGLDGRALRRVRACSSRCGGHASSGASAAAAAALPDGTVNAATSPRAPTDAAGHGDAWKAASARAPTAGKAAGTRAMHRGCPRRRLQQPRPRPLRGEHRRVRVRRRSSATTARRAVAAGIVGRRERRPPTGRSRRTARRRRGASTGGAAAGVAVAVRLRPRVARRAVRAPRVRGVGQPHSGRRRRARGACGAHGTCVDGACRCDAGYVATARGLHCVKACPLAALALWPLRRRRVRVCRRLRRRRPGKRRRPLSWRLQRRGQCGADDRCSCLVRRWRRRCGSVRLCALELLRPRDMHAPSRRRRAAVAARRRHRRAALAPIGCRRPGSRRVCDDGWVGHAGERGARVPEPVLGANVEHAGTEECACFGGWKGGDCQERHACCDADVNDAAGRRTAGARARGPAAACPAGAAARASMPVPARGRRRATTAAPAWSASPPAPASRARCAAWRSAGGGDADRGHGEGFARPIAPATGNTCSRRTSI